MHLPTSIRVNFARAAAEKGGSAHKNGAANGKRVISLPGLKEFRESTLVEAERQYFKDLLSLTDRNIEEACRISGLGRARLYELMKKYDLSRSD